MAHVEPDAETAGTEDLTERPVRAYLGDDEAVHAVLTNSRVGVTRADDAGTNRIEPGSDHGAVAVLSDRRALFAVGRPDGDDVTSVPYVEFAAVDTRTEMLARSLVVETVAGVTWEFTVRESAALDDATAHLSSAVPARFLEQAGDRRQAADRAKDRQRRIEALEGTVESYRRATTVVDEPDVATAATREEAEAAIADLLDARLARARDRRSVGNWSAEAGEVDEALARYEAACDCFERAIELAERYPPGDADAIATEREHLVEKCDALEITASVSNVID